MKIRPTLFSPLFSTVIQLFPSHATPPQVFNKRIRQVLDRPLFSGLSRAFIFLPSNTYVVFVVSAYRGKIIKSKYVSRFMQFGCTSTTHHIYN